MIPESLTWLFWDVDPATIDLVRHRSYVLDRAMARGDLEAMRWVVRTFTRSQLAEHVTHRGHRLPPRDRAFWSLIAGVQGQVDSELGGGRPVWVTRPA